MSDSESVRALFANLLRQSTDKTVVSGRYASDGGKEPAIWQDILAKLRPKRGGRLINIGCGYSPLTDMCIELCLEQDISLTLMDSPELLAKVREEWSGRLNELRICFIEGYFPQDLPIDRRERGTFDSILAYSVLHYVEDPSAFLDEAIALLAPEGALLIGDIPNPNRKARFLASEAGRRFEAAYRNLTVAEIPSYSDQQEYIERNRTVLNLKIGDDFLLPALQKLRARDCEAYLLPQPDGLPFSRTREDLLVIRR